MHAALMFCTVGACAILRAHMNLRTDDVLDMSSLHVDTATGKLQCAADLRTRDHGMLLCMRPTSYVISYAKPLPTTTCHGEPNFLSIWSLIIYAHVHEHMSERLNECTEQLQLTVMFLACLGSISMARVWQHGAAPLPGTDSRAMRGSLLAAFYIHIEV